MVAILKGFPFIGLNVTIHVHVMPSIKSQFEDCVKFDNTNGTANVGKSAGRDAEIYLPYHFVNQLVTFKKCSILP